jgi:hypothetical protein
VSASRFFSVATRDFREYLEALDFAVAADSKKLKINKMVTITYCKSKHYVCHRACVQLYDNYFGKLAFIVRQPILFLLFLTSPVLVLFPERDPWWLRALDALRSLPCIFRSPNHKQILTDRQFHLLYFLLVIFRFLPKLV